MFEDLFRRRAVQLKQIADDLNTKGEDKASPSLFDQDDSQEFSEEEIEAKLLEEIQILEIQMKERWNYFTPPLFSSQDINI